MNNNEIVTRLRTFLETEFPNQGVELTESTDLLDDWFVDSLGIIETVLFIEQTFAVPVTRSDINGTNFRNIAALSAFIADRLGD